MRAEKILKGHIAVRPSTLQYIRWREFLPEQSSLSIPGKTPFASFLTTQFSFCAMFHSEGFFPPPPAPQLNGFTARLPFECHGSLATENIFQLINFTAARLDDFCYDLMYDDLIREIICGKYAKGHEKTIVEDFLRDRGLEDNIQWDAAIKAVYRIRKGRGITSFRGHARFAIAV
jgi:hypothetical protein